ncbi:MAG: peptide-methionine (R)-S-oxide reductase MsrB [Sphingomonadales bacterium]|nr:peptide-methionine (R)-S-oxide reductase MsrB [Sphingomonadales bacterium]
MRCRPLIVVVLFGMMATSWVCVSPNGDSRRLNSDTLKKDSMTYKIEKTEEEWKALLGEEAYRVLRLKGTERPFTSEYETLWDPGTYVCKGCGQELFTSETKFDASCGWPSFYQSIDKTRVKEIADYSHGMSRVEVVCSACGGHLGHVFNDGFGQPTGLRYCINGVSLGFRKK